uniref:Probable 3-oxoacyl-[acyl-carrier-protein] reductase oxidoreductase (EC) n=1 Tax=Ganoderma boninense TaxID=34458 RepID=A0A5K1K1U1_9APHY|nr:Probable 3-oxoacyl-[acyl-carrier-protein] reductase oxidoreductase (EC [Ganoderma boninense]
MGPNPTHLNPSLKSRPVGIRDLASELLVHTLSFLDTQDIARCIGVCRYFADLVRCELFLQYRIELARNGMVDGPSGTLPVAKRLQRIHQYSANLCSGTLDHETLDSHPEFARQFLNLEWSSLRPPNISATAMFRESSKMVLSIFTRGSSKAGVPSRRWLMPIGTPRDHTRRMNDWAVDRAQDLLVTVEKVYTDMNGQPSKGLLRPVIMISKGLPFYP